MDIPVGIEAWAEIKRLEESLWRAETRYDDDYMERILAPDFLEFGKSGRVYERREMFLGAGEPIQAVLPFPNFFVRLLSAEVMQVTYDSEVVDGGTIEKARRTSIWSRSPSGWILRFHQGTPIPDPS